MTNMTPRRQLNEKIDWIMQGDSEDERKRRAKEVAAQDSTFLPYLRMAYLTSHKLVGLPDGMPDTYKPEPDIPDGIAYTVASKEFRRINNFHPASAENMALKPAIREQQWIKIMEGLHWKEARVLIAIKDQQLDQLYPGFSDLLKSLGMPVDIVPTDSKSPLDAAPTKTRGRPKGKKTT